MLNEKVAALCNEQINKEFYSAYLYLDIANYYADQGLDGFANWYTIQAQEERDHAMLFLQYLQNNGEKVTLEAIAKPDKEFSCHRCALEVGYEHEQYVTSLINTIYEAAYAVKDFRTMQFLDWFVKEQGEEGEERRRHAQEVRPVRFRSQGSVFAQQRAGCAGLYCAVADALSL